MGGGGEEKTTKDRKGEIMNGNNCRHECHLECGLLIFSCVEVSKLFVNLHIFSF